MVAHRGASAHRAEHTLDAYALALAQGADGLECDVRLTGDGHLVCVHDRTVNRTSSGRGAVSGLTLAQLSALDFGGWHDPWPGSADELVRQPAVVPSASEAGHGPLTLDDLLGLVIDTSPGAKVFVETKHPVRYAGLVEARLVALLARHGLASPADRESSRVVVMSFTSRALRRIRDYAPLLPTVLLLERFGEYRNGSLPPWADVAGPSIDMVRADPGYVVRARARGHDVYCWTVDDPADIALCHRLGVRYIATNSPENARRVLGRERHR